jgi:hypothetical protein
LRADVDARRQAAHHLFGETVVWIADLTPAVTTIDMFAARAREAREGRAWWTAFARVQADATRGDGHAETRLDERVPLSITEFAERFGASNDTIERAIKAGLNDPEWME